MMLALVRQVVIVCLMLLVLPATPGYSQETTGTILGTLVDQTGAGLPGVKVTIVRVDTGLIHEVVTNNAGQYSENLPAGNYEISFFLPNVQPFTAREISFPVNARLQVNGKLEVTAVETLTVTAELLVQPTSAVQNLIQGSAVRELPLLTRTPIQLVTLVPGVPGDLRTEACFCDQGPFRISINSARWSAVAWLLDGASNVNVWCQTCRATSGSRRVLVIRAISTCPSTPLGLSSSPTPCWTELPTFTLGTITRW